MDNSGHPIKAPVVIDIEASGFGRGSYPIEVGVALEDGSTQCFLICPAPGWDHWDPAAEVMHGISRETLTRHGTPVAEVARRLNALLQYNTIYTDAWSYDRTWLALLFEQAAEPQRFRLESLRALLTEDHVLHWQTEKAKVIDTLGLTRHRASTDAVVIQHTLLNTLRRTQSTASPET